MACSFDSLIVLRQRYLAAPYQIFWVCELQFGRPQPTKITFLCFVPPRISAANEEALLRVGRDQSDSVCELLSERFRFWTRYLILFQGRHLYLVAGEIPAIRRISWRNCLLVSDQRRYQRMVAFLKAHFPEVSLNVTESLCETNAKIQKLTRNFLYVKCNGTLMRRTVMLKWSILK